MSSRHHPAHRAAGGPGWGPDNANATAGPADVRCTNPATTNPPVATRRRIPPTWTRAIAARSSKKPIAAATAFPVGGRHHPRHRLGTQRPQQRHALGRRKRQIERPHPTGPQTHQQIRPRGRMVTVAQRPQLAGLHHPRHTQTGRPPPRPHSRRLPHPRVVLVNAQRHRRDQILSIGQTSNRQHVETKPEHDIKNNKPATTTVLNRPSNKSRPRSQRATDTCHPSGEANPGALTPGPNPSRKPPDQPPPDRPLGA